jgi:hypothetical protein
MLSYALIVSMLAIGFAPMAYEISKGRFDFFNLKNTFIIYFVIQLGLSGLATIYLDMPSDIGLDTVTQRADYDYALLISTIGLLCFQIGYHSRRARREWIPSAIKRQWSTPKLHTMVCLYILMGMFGFVAIVQINGGLSSFLASREEFRAGGLVGLGIFLFPATGMMAIAALAHLLQYTGKAMTRIGYAKAVAVLCIALLPAYFLGFRSAIALPILQFVVAWNYTRKRLPPGKIALVSLSIVGLFTFYGISRAIPSETGFNFDDFARIATERPELVYGVISRSRGTEVVAAVTAKLEQTGEYEYGWPSALETLTIIIPKAIWPDKPQAISERFANYFFGEALTEARGYEAENWSGISPTVIAEWYWHLGLPGVIFGLFILGRIAARVYASLQQNREHPGAVLCYCIVFASFSMFAESQQNYTNGLVLYTAALALTFGLINKGKGKSAKPRADPSGARGIDVGRLRP